MVQPANKRLVTFAGLQAAIASTIAATTATVALSAATGADDTAALNTALAAVDPAKATRVVGAPGSSYRISAPLIAKSNTTLVMAGCSVTEIAGSNCQMFRNAAYRGTGARDHDVYVTGGTWDRGNNAGPTARDTLNLVMHRIDQCGVFDVLFKSTNSKWAITFGDVDGFRTRDIKFDDAFADGIHVLGPAKNGAIRDTYGTCGDDMVAIVCTDYTDYELTPGGGSITDVSIYNTHPDNTVRNTVRLVPGQGFVLDRILVDGVFGAAAFNGVNIRGDDSFPATHGGTIGTIILKNLDVDVPADQAVVALGEPIDKLDIDTIVVKASGGVNFKNTPGYPAGIDLRVKSLNVRNIHSAVDAPSRLVTVDAGCAVDQLQIDGVTGVLDSTKADGDVLHLTGTVGLAQISRVDVKGGSALAYIGPASAVTGGKIMIANIDQTGAAFGVRHLGDFLLEVVGSVIDMHGIAIARAAGTGATNDLILNAAALATSAVSSITRSGTQKLRAIGFQVRADVSTLTPTVGDICWSTVASAVCGSGPVIYSADSTWHPLSGFVTRGTPTLVNGAVTVSDPRITINSQIRLDRRSFSGAPGPLYLSAKAAGTGFTISSTSGTDNGQVEYLVERY